jgi:hypothetical protein
MQLSTDLIYSENNRNENCVQFQYCVVRMEIADIKEQRFGMLEQRPTLK